MDGLRRAHVRFLRESILIRLSFWFGLLLVWVLVVHESEGASVPGTPWWAWIGVAVVGGAFIAFDALPTISARRHRQSGP